MNSLNAVDPNRITVVSGCILYIYHFFKSINSKFAVILLAALVYRDSELLPASIKKEIIRGLAVRFNKASFCLKRVCLLDYYFSFILIHKITNPRQSKFLYRKCLAYRDLGLRNINELNFELS